MGWQNLWRTNWNSTGRTIRAPWRSIRRFFFSTSIRTTSPFVVRTEKPFHLEGEKLHAVEKEVDGPRAGAVRAGPHGNTSFDDGLKPSRGAHHVSGSESGHYGLVRVRQSAASGSRGVHHERRPVSRALERTELFPVRPERAL